MALDSNSSHYSSGKILLNQPFRLIKHIDFTLIFLVTGLCILGLLIIYSSTHQESIKVGAAPVVRRQLIYIFVGIITCFFVALIDYHEIAKIALPFYVLSLILLIYVLIGGKDTGGSRRWIQLLGYEFQPAELGKIALIIFIADFLNRQKNRFSSLLYFLFPLLFTVIYMLLIYRQPDLGTAIVYFGITIFMIFIAGISWKYILTTSIAFISLFPIVWSFLKDYQKSRLLLFINPEKDPLGAGYNIIQSKVAIGSGGLFGKGLFGGIQSQLKFLPAQHTDFVFAVIGEELGFAGAILLISLYFLLLWKGIKIAQEAPDLLGMFLATGVTAFLFVHIFVNIGMSMGLMPATGLPLPFISHGGTFMLTNFIGIGLLMNIYIRSKFI